MSLNYHTCRTELRDVDLMNRLFFYHHVNTLFKYLLLVQTIYLPININTTIFIIPFKFVFDYLLLKHTKQRYGTYTFGIWFCVHCYLFLILFLISLVEAINPFFTEAT